MAVKGLHLVCALGHLLHKGGQVGVGDRVAVPSHSGGRSIELLDGAGSLLRVEILRRVVPLFCAEQNVSSLLRMVERTFW